MLMHLALHGACTLNVNQYNLYRICAPCFLAGAVVVQRDSHIKSKADVAHVAGALIRATLPMHYHITVNGSRI